MGSRSIGLARNKVTLCQAMETMLVKEKNQGKFDETMCLDYKVEDVKGREKGSIWLNHYLNYTTEAELYIDKRVIYNKFKLLLLYYLASLYNELRHYILSDKHHLFSGSK